ncbi:unnamed protein product [Soboliphyme baturini]|uniref:Sepiapterin reductase n=1 Tax=Soboliphyme baturini TaxID=241478 RepID=A0A183ILI2_9BILA|nr:unnamed protein product [Soboliphyme baturini]
MAQLSLLGKKTVCLVSGASRGIGRAMALALAQKFACGSTMILMARNLHMLNAVKLELARIAPNISVFLCSTDLSVIDKKVFEKMFAEVKQQLCSMTTKIDVAMIVHNAATIGPIHKHCSQLDSATDLREYFDMNVISPILLNTTFLENFGPDFVSQRVVINISSGAAYSAISGLHLYSAGKAARDSFFRVLSDEEPEIRVLNFNPGPVVTDMQLELGSKVWNEAVMKWSKDGSEAGTFATPCAVAEKLVHVLDENSFKSGCFMTMDETTLKFSFE